jgi:hypothetical protein
MPVNNGFRVNDLCEMKKKQSATAWPLTGTLVPISDTMEERKPYSKEK